MLTLSFKRMILIKFGFSCPPKQNKNWIWACDLTKMTTRNYACLGYTLWQVRNDLLLYLLMRWREWLNESLVDCNKWILTLILWITRYIPRWYKTLLYELKCMTTLCYYNYFLKGNGLHNDNKCFECKHACLNPFIII